MQITPKYNSVNVIFQCCCNSLCSLCSNVVVLGKNDQWNWIWYYKKAAILHANIIQSTCCSLPMLQQSFLPLRLQLRFPVQKIKQNEKLKKIFYLWHPQIQ